MCERRVKNGIGERERERLHEIYDKWLLEPTASVKKIQEKKKKIQSVTEGILGLDPILKLN